jgi:predicted HAD superfamily Cof-like phosphohydrolase
MRTEQNQIKEFMIKTGQECPPRPKIPSREVIELRIKLIAEELLELCDAVGADLHIESGQVQVRVDPGFPVDLVGAYDALIDIAVVDVGAFNAFGFEIDPGWEEVHRSNMSKFIDGYRRADGKWVKGPSYSPANLQPLLEDQCRKTTTIHD